MAKRLEEWRDNNSTEKDEDIPIFVEKNEPSAEELEELEYFESLRKRLAELEFDQPDQKSKEEYQYIKDQLDFMERQ